MSDTYRKIGFASGIGASLFALLGWILVGNIGIIIGAPAGFCAGWIAYDMRVVVRTTRDTFSQFLRGTRLEGRDFVSQLSRTWRHNIHSCRKAIAYLVRESSTFLPPLLFAIGVLWGTPVRSVLEVPNEHWLGLAIIWIFLLYIIFFSAWCSLALFGYSWDYTMPQSMDRTLQNNLAVEHGSGLSGWRNIPIWVVLGMFFAVCAGTYCTVRIIIRKLSSTERTTAGWSAVLGGWVAMYFILPILPDHIPTIATACFVALSGGICGAVIGMGCWWIRQMMPEIPLTEPAKM